MSYFRMSYRVLYGDTMALGWHHFLTNFTFQCEAREQYFFGHLLDDPATAAALADVVVVTHDGYSRNLGQVPPGGVVGILMSYEDGGPCSVRFCFRVIRDDGVPIACGYQKLVAVSVKSGAMIAAPEAFKKHERSIRERLVCPSFADRVHSGIGLDAVFDDETIRLGRLAAAGTREGAVPTLLEAPVDGGVVFLFPGTGSAYPELLLEIASQDSRVPALIRDVTDITEDVLGIPLAPLLDPSRASDHLASHPELVPVVVYLGSVLTARLLRDRGIEPGGLAGHSMGEIAALATGGAFSLERGVEVVATRARELRPVTGAGGMLALTCTEPRTRALIDSLGPTGLDIAVVNGTDQTVVSGSPTQLDQLDRLAEHLGIGRFRLSSSIAYHGRSLRPCVDPWSRALAGLGLRPPAKPVYSPMERGFYQPEDDLSKLLPSQLTRPLHFADAISDLVAAGGTLFLECGGGQALSGIGRRMYPGSKELRFLPTFAAPGAASQNLDKIHETCEIRVAPPARPLQLPERKPAASRSKRASVRKPAPARIAVVGMGCVLPAAFDPQALWKMVLAGETSVTAESSEVLIDYMSTGEMPVSDKTYSPMRGRIEGFVEDTTKTRFGTSTQRYLAAAMRQSLERMGSAIPAQERIQILIGSTADGCLEYEDALLVATLAEALAAAPEDGRRGRQLRALEAAVGRPLADAVDLSPWLLYSAVARELIGPAARVTALDAACASSLYAVSTAVRALELRECDLALAGGVFSPGVANSCLFAQFRGLSRTGSRPLDVEADGVVFSEGAGILALKRLEDAEAAGDTVLALVQGVGLSSDGKSPSVMEPREAGQLLSLERAYTSCGIDPASVQYLEAHATATVVGDAVEVKAASRIFARSSAPVNLGSVKGNFGHTGWAAGVTSLIKVITAMQTGTVPPQAAFTAPSPRLDLGKSVFVIPSKAKEWPDREGIPRRAAVNGFGFGGSNAHVVVEAPGPASAPVSGDVTEVSLAAAPIAIVAASGMFPGRGARFSPEELELPPGILILPDIVDHMDRSNFVALAATARTLGTLPGWKSLAEETGVVLGIEGKTGRGVDSTLRIHRDKLKGVLDRTPELERSELDDLWSVLESSIQRVLPSGPYTLPGSMPNVVAGRVTSAFDLRGPNLVVDSHRTSILAALEMGCRWIRSGEAQVALAGGLHADAHPGIARLVRASVAVPETRSIGEGCVVLALTTPELAREMGWPILAMLGAVASAGATGPTATVPAPVRVGLTGTCLMAAEGAREIVAALDDLRGGMSETSIAWPGGETLVLSSPPGAVPVERPALEVLLSAVELTQAPLDTMQACSLAGRRLLVVASRSLPSSIRGALAGTTWKMVSPPGAGGDLEVDVTNEAGANAALEAIASDPPELILVVKELAEEPLDAMCRGPDPVMELSFLLCRKLYDMVGEGRVGVAFLCTSPWTVTGQLHPSTGLFAGFAKSVAGELPGASVKVLHTDEQDAGELRECLERELPHASRPPPAPLEVGYRRGFRLGTRLVALEEPTMGSSLLHPGSVVLAIGGARGVTAVLVESLLEKFGCTVGLIGRSDPAAVDDVMVDLDESGLAGAEAGFLARELARAPGTRPAAVKGRWEQLKAAREAALTLRHLNTLPGRVVYAQADVTVAAAVDEAVATLHRQLGRFDLVLYGAGVQVSRLLSRRSLGDFRHVLGTKLEGLGHVMRAVSRHQADSQPHVHLLSSATGLVGAPGAQDYAAANEALNRLALARSDEGGEGDWTSVAWPWWRGVGMGTAFDQLPAAHGLPAISRDEGKQVFARLMEGRSIAPVISVIHRNDAARLPIAPAVADPSRPRSLLDHWTIDVSRFPFLADHRVDGIPTMPGAYLIDMAVRSALKLRPGDEVVRVHGVRLLRFVKCAPGRPLSLSTHCRVTAEEGPETFVQVKFFSDFVHRDGTVLRRDDVHATVIIVLSSEPSAPPHHARLPIDRSAYTQVPEPFRHPDSRIYNGGPFHRLGRIYVSEAMVQSSLRPASADQQGAMSGTVVPVVPLDALFRLSSYESRPTSVLPVVVPMSCHTIHLPLRKIDEQETLTLEIGRRVYHGAQQQSDWAEARDHKGHVVLRAEGLAGLKIGTITMTLDPLEREELP